MIHVYIGNGKGKTTAAVGACVRAVGAGMTVGFVSFLKDGSSSELSSLRVLDRVTVYPHIAELPFVFRMSDKQKSECRAFYEDLCLNTLVGAFSSNSMMVLDEILDAVDTGLLSEQILIRLIDEAECHQTELILTGHSASPAILDKAHYITDMHAQKHPYESGTPARRGIEY